MKIWTLGAGSGRSRGRPRECNGDPGGFDDVAFKCANRLLVLLDDTESFLDHCT